MALSFKNDLPVGCPDSKVKTIEEDMHCYHVTKEYPPGKNDFIPAANKARKIKDHLLCQSKGLSILESLDDIKRLVDTIPNIGIYILCGTVRYRLDGLIKLTPSGDHPSHRTWYPYEWINESIVFHELVEKYERT